MELGFEAVATCETLQLAICPPVADCCYSKMRNAMLLTAC